MDERALTFERHRAHLTRVAHRMLGSSAEADDAVQEAWLRFSRAEISGLESVRGWLTTVVARICLDVLRQRRSRREDVLVDRGAAEGDPEREMELAESIGLALLVVLETLSPAERLAFVLHDLFGMAFDEIAGVLGKSPDAARQLASRARRRVRGARASGDVSRQREIVEAFLAAARGGDLDGLLAVLDPDVVVKNGARELRGAHVAARAAIKGGARAARAALVDGAVGVVVAPGGRLLMVLVVTFAGERIAAVEAVTDRERLAAMELRVIPGAA